MEGFAAAQLFWCFVVLAILLIVARAIRQRVRWLRRLFLPSSIIAGALALLLGPEALGWVMQQADRESFANGLFPGWMPAGWAELPGLLINVVFAALLMGKPIPGLKRIWYYAGPQVCFGQTLAWGQYVVGILLTMLVLGPFFGVPPIAGALIEISFEGGHGTAGGMGEAFEEAGWAAGQDLALGLATIGLVGGVVIGTVLINWAARRGIIQPEGGTNVEQISISGQDVTEDELTEYRNDRERENQPTDPLSLHLGLVALAIAMGWGLLTGLQWLEYTLRTIGEPDATFAGFTGVLTYVPLFPLAMIGGVFIQWLFDRFGQSDRISDRLMNRISGAALDFTIVAALGALSLQAISEYFVPFLLLALAGIAWCTLAVFILAPRIIPTCWFERGVGDFGQSMGVTVTGLLLMRVADPANRSGAMESFGYKQLLFEPVVGGGLFTGASIGLILNFGAPTMLAVTACLTVFWIAFGFIAFGRLAKQNRAAERTL
jgi:ESS family glutamate:Na+ symporter